MHRLSLLIINVMPTLQFSHVAFGLFTGFFILAGAVMCIAGTDIDRDDESDLRKVVVVRWLSCDSSAH